MLNFERSAHCQTLMLNELIGNVQNLKLIVIVEHSCLFNGRFHSGRNAIIDKFLEIKKAKLYLQ